MTMQIARNHNHRLLTLRAPLTTDQHRNHALRSTLSTVLPKKRLEQRLIAVSAQHKRSACSSSITRKITSSAAPSS
jgi:hypothetical protein